MCRGGGGGGIFSICTAWSLTHCHSWNNLPCIHNSSPSSPPATDHLLQPSLSTPTPPHIQQGKSRSSNRLGTPLSRRVEKPEARRGFGPSTHYINGLNVIYRKSLDLEVHLNHLIERSYCSISWETSIPFWYFLINMTSKSKLRELAPDAYVPRPFWLQHY